MTKQEKVVSILQSLGFKPQIDEEGDIFIRYQMKTFYVMNANSDDEDYLIVVYPQMYEIDEGEETIVLAACNKMTREIKLAKLYIDQTLKNVSASCEFYYNGEESLKTCLDKAIEILGMVRPAFVKTMCSFDWQLPEFIKEVKRETDCDLERDMAGWYSGLKLRNVPKWKKQQNGYDLTVGQRRLTTSTLDFTIVFK